MLVYRNNEFGNQFILIQLGVLCDWQYVIDIECERERSIEAIKNANKNRVQWSDKSNWRKNVYDFKFIMALFSLDRVSVWNYTISFYALDFNCYLRMYY